MTATPKTTTLRYRVLSILGEIGPNRCDRLVPEGSDFFKTRGALVNARNEGLVISLAGGALGTRWALTPLGVKYLDAMEQGLPWSTACLRSFHERHD